MRESPADKDVSRGYCWNPLPATASEDIEDLACAEKQSARISNNAIITWSYYL